MFLAARRCETETLRAETTEFDQRFRFHSHLLGAQNLGVKLLRSLEKDLKLRRSGSHHPQGTHRGRLHREPCAAIQTHRL